jgi:hypothetical protein
MIPGCGHRGYQSEGGRQDHGYGGVGCGAGKRSLPDMYSMHVWLPDARREIYQARVLWIRDFDRIGASFFASLSI